MGLEVLRDAAPSINLLFINISVESGNDVLAHVDRFISHFAHLALLDWRLTTWTLSLIFAEYGQKGQLHYDRPSYA